MNILYVSGEGAIACSTAVDKYFLKKESGVSSQESESRRDARERVRLPLGEYSKEAALIHSEFWLLTPEFCFDKLSPNVLGDVEKSS